jgi:FMN phosphatase YigB (HAD superfamily)
MIAPSPIVFLFDVDNTLLDNDHIVADLSAHLAQAFPYAEKVQQYWDTLQNAGRRAGTHHLVVWLFDKASKKPIANAEVTVDLAETGFAGSEKGLFLTTMEEIPAYSGYFAMKAGIRYRNPGAC